MIESIRKRTRLPLDVHLMIEEPERWVETYVKAGADYVTVHAEACAHLERALAMIREAGARAGVALNPSTPPEVLQYVLDDLDLVLVMSVNPGFGGQSFIPTAYEKIRRLRAMLADRPVLVSVDGGVKADNAGPPGPGRGHRAGGGLRHLRRARSGRRAGRPAECVGSTEKGLTFSGLVSIL